MTANLIHEPGHKQRIAVLGAGPAGLTAAWCLRNNQEFEVHIFESEDQVGGISKTVKNGDWRFDLGGHRFFSKSDRVNNLWNEMLLPEKFLLRPRKSRIYYNGKFFDYPLKPLNALVNLGLKETILCILSYAWVKIKPPKNQKTFEGWVAARFGWRLYRIFFKTYTEKVWGISTQKLQSTWAAQRIKNLSLLGAIKDAFGFSKKNTITTLIDEFKYPRFGPGQLWENVAKKLQEQEIGLHLRSKIHSVELNAGYSLAIKSGGVYVAEKVFSSIPLSEVPKLLNAPRSILDFAEKLKFRDFLVVAIPVSADIDLFDDNWIYIHDPMVRVGRIQNYRSWSPDLVPEGASCLGLEYFVNEDDEIWNLSDSSLIQLAKEELSKIGIHCKYLDDSGFVVRVPKAYPVYDADYEQSVESIRNWLAKAHPNWFQIGRNGQHHYNNQDHSMLTAFYAVSQSIGLDSENYWEVNLDDEYHELSDKTRQAPVFN